jgi:hypothetical protein
MTIDSEEFDNLMATYRCMPGHLPAEVSAAYWAVIEYIDKKIAEGSVELMKEREGE